MADHEHRAAEGGATEVSEPTGLRPSVTAGVRLPELAPGDLLAFGTTGAYGLSEGMTHFLSHPVPPEAWVD